MRTLPERTDSFYRSFVNLANKNVPHPLDRERFYHFIIAAHQGRTKLSHWDVLEMLIRDGFEEEDSKAFAEKYKIGRDVLQAQKSFPFFYYLRQRQEIAKKPSKEEIIPPLN